MKEPIEKFIIVVLAIVGAGFIVSVFIAVVEAVFGL